MLIRFVRHFLIAIQFFTRIPITGRLAKWVGYSPTMLRNSAAYFPAVGWLVGALSAGVFVCFVDILPTLPATPWVAAVLSTTFSILLTGAFHEDGLADTADGLGGGLTREQALEIMKDSRIGTYGSTALLLAMLSKLSLLVLLYQIDLVWSVIGLFAAHVTSRLMPLFLIRAMTHVGDMQKSKSKPLADTIKNSGLLIGLLWWIAAIVLVAYFVSTLPLLIGTLGAVIPTAFMAWRLHQRLQGFTGDGLGATQQLSEIGFYLGLVIAAGIL
jgi:adenosylcobinamide-GDP ribazoletransferase